MSKFKIYKLFKHNKELIDHTGWLTSKSRARARAQKRSDEDSKAHYALFEKVSDVEGRYLAFFTDGEEVQRYQVKDGPNVVAGGTSIDELQALGEKARELSMTSSAVTLIDLMEKHPMVFRGGKELNPDFRPVSAAA